KIDVAFRVVADHIRTLSCAIADGIQPSNEGRGYVLRRILRRAVRYGRSLGFYEPFFYKLVDVVAITMGDVFPELSANQPYIEATLRREEKSFNRTLDRGMDVFDKAAVDAIKLQAIATPEMASVSIRVGGRERYFANRPGATLEIDAEKDNSKLFDQVFE